jgi:hypothetical protein
VLISTQNKHQKSKLQHPKTQHFTFANISKPQKSQQHLANQPISQKFEIYELRQTGETEKALEIVRPQGQIINSQNLFVINL